MAKSDAIWGIDVGQCALKALRCRAHGDGKRLIAEAYDFIEYPKILSQPDADPAALVADAIEQFISRNDVKGERVAISVSGQSGLGPIHQASAGRVEEDPRHRQVRGPPADSVRAGRRRVGLPADAGRQRGRWLRTRDRGRLVRDETRSGISRLKAVYERQRGSGYRSAHANLAVQLHPLRSDAEPSAAGRVRPRKSAGKHRGNVDGDRDHGSGGDERVSRVAAEHPVGRKPLHEGDHQGDEGHLHEGRASEAQQR